MAATVKLLVTIPHPSTELRIQGTGALQVLAQLRQLYPGLVVTDEGLEADASDGDGEWLDITQTDWYRTRAAQITAGRCLRIYRENAGLSLAKLEEASGIEKRYLMQMEHGQQAIGETTAHELARHLGCHYQSLM